MPTDDCRDVSRLAEAILVAETTYQRAREQHKRARSPLSRRVLIEARNRLEYLEQCAFDKPAPCWEPKAPSCPKCGRGAHGERWSALDRPSIDLPGARGRVVRPIPDWAVEQALRGAVIVQRLWCAHCRATIAVYSGDPEA
jgi:hypothetical protein